MESDDNVSGEFQRSTRMPLDAVVRLHFQGTVAYQNGFAANVSATGMFVKHPAPPPLGTQLVFEFNLGAERKPVQGAGEVVWVRDRYLGPGQPAGVGIRFLQLDTQSRDHIAEALFEYLEQSLAEDSLLDESGISHGAETTATAPAATPAAAVDELATAAAGRTELAVPPAELAARVAAEPFDFAALEKLPRRAAPEVPPESQRAFSVFSSLDDADAQTANIVREALREEAPLPSIAAAAAVSRRPSSPWRLGLLILALAGAGGYFAWTQWGSRLGLAGAATVPRVSEVAPAAPPAGRRPEPLTADQTPGTTLAQQVGVHPEALPPAPTLPGSPPAPAEEPSDVAAAAAERADTARAEPAPAARAAVAETAAPPPAAPFVAPVAPAASPNPTPPGSARAQRLVGIEWSAAGDASGQTTLVLSGDAAFAPGAFSYSEIGGENPRVLIKLKGMESPYRGPAPHGGGTLTPLVRGVRTGFHLTTAGNEIHVVVDLARGGVRVVSLAPDGADGSALTLRLAL